MLPLALPVMPVPGYVQLNFASKIKTFNYFVFKKGRNTVTDYGKTARKIMAGDETSVNDYFDSAVECEPYSFWLKASSALALSACPARW